MNIKYYYLYGNLILKNNQSKSYSKINNDKSISNCKFDSSKLKSKKGLTINKKNKIFNKFSFSKIKNNYKNDTYKIHKKNRRIDLISQIFNRKVLKKSYFNNVKIKKSIFNINNKKFIQNQKYSIVKYKHKNNESIINETKYKDFNLKSNFQLKKNIICIKNIFKKFNYNINK